MRDKVTPSTADEAHLARSVDEILSQARSVARTFHDEGTPSFDPIIVGSTAKGTWLPGQVDIDLFLMFDPALGRDDLEALGLRAGKAILPDWGLRYAEHPYVHGTYDGYDADVVPAYAVDEAVKIQSAVDRTPFHNAYVLAALEEAPDRRLDIRLMKAWLKGIGVYGAETAKGGISGYLTEVLTLHHGGFLPAVEAFRTYGPGTRIDPAGTSDAAFPSDLLVVIDPVDPGRNAAGAVRRERLDRLVAAATAFLERPDVRFFEPHPLPPLDPDLAHRTLGPHGAAILTFPVPDMRDDAIVPHLTRAAEGLGNIVAREGFDILATDGGVSTDGSRAYLYLRTAQPALPETRLHLGPPATAGDRATEFRAKYADHPDVVRPVHEVEDRERRRLAVVLRQHARTLPERIEKVLGRNISLGKHATKAIRAGYAVLHPADAVAAPDLERVVAELLSPVQPWERSGDAAHDYPLAGGNGRSGGSG